MSVIAIFEVTGATASKYDEVIRRLTAIGQRVPDGQLYHVCYGDTERLQVIDVFESQAKLDAFGAKLMPILQEMDITAKPAVFEVYNIIEGAKGTALKHVKARAPERARKTGEQQRTRRKKRSR